MAMARRCDICGKYYSPYGKVYKGELVNGIAFSHADVSSLYKAVMCDYDLCPECITSMIAYIDSLKDKKSTDHIDDYREDDLK